MIFPARIAAYNGRHGAITIEKASLTVTAVNKQRKYGELNPVFEASYTGFKNDEDFEKSDLTGQPGLTTIADTLTPIGTYTITASEGELASRNYTMTYVDGDLKIDPAQIAVTIANKTKTYGDANPSLTYVYSGFVNEETLANSGVTGQPVITTTVTTSTGAGLYDITLGKGTLASSNYDFDLVNGSLFVDKATLSVTADNKTRTYGQNNPAFTATIEGFVNNETLSTAGLLGQASLTTGASSGIGNNVVNCAAHLSNFAGVHLRQCVCQHLVCI